MEHSVVVARYLRHTRSGARTAREDERRLVGRARGRDPEAVATLVADHLGFVVHVAKELRGRGVPFEDLIWEGCVGLLKAARRFDPDNGARFITYASFWVRKAILDALAEQPRVVRTPRYARERGHFAPREIRIEAEIPGTDGVLLADRLVDRTARPAVERLIARQERQRLRRHLLLLPAREQAVLASRFGLHGDGALTLNEVGLRLGISRERVRQIETAGLARLRGALAGRQAASRALRLAPSQT